MTTQWITRPVADEADIDIEVMEEAALAMAQATIQNAIDQAEISRSDLARKMGRPRSFVSKMLSGSHNLTVKTLARAMAGCGFQLDFRYAPIRWGWVASQETVSAPHANVPASAGTLVLTDTRR